MSLGARLIVIFVEGIAKPVLVIADDTLSSDSFTAASGKPTINILASPFCPEFTSTSTLVALAPIKAPEYNFDNIFYLSQKNTQNHSAYFYKALNIY